MTTVYIVAVALVDDDTIGDLHDAALDALQLVARTGHLDEQEEVDHRVTGGLALSDTDGLDEDLVKARSLTEDNGLTRLTGHTAEGTCRRTRTDEGVRMLGELLHARLVAEDRALGALAGGVDGQHSQTAAFLLEHMDAKLIDGGTLAGSRHAADTHSHGIAAIGQTLVNDLLGTRLMVGVDTLDEGDGLGKDGNIALEDTFYHLSGGELTTTETVTVQVGVDDRGLLDTTVHLQACIF